MGEGGGENPSQTCRLSEKKDFQEQWEPTFTPRQKAEGRRSARGSIYHTNGTGTIIMTLTLRNTTSPPPPSWGGEHTSAWRKAPQISQEEDHNLTNNMLYKNKYEEAHWKALQDQAVPMRDVINHIKAMGLDLTLCPHNPHK